MFKGKLVALSLVAAALLCWQMLPVGTANSGIVDPCSSTASVSCTDPPACLYLCPQGDAPPLNALDFGGDCTITVRARDATGAPIPGMLAGDIWLIGCGDSLVLCGGSASVNADSNTNSQGYTTISGSPAASGCDLAGISVVIQGVIVADPINCNNRLCLSLPAVSCDLPRALDGICDNVDFTDFGFNYQSPPKPYDPCLDFSCDGLVDLVDFTAFGFHYFHQC
jgi:hypothetical protein